MSLPLLITICFLLPSIFGGIIPKGSQIDHDEYFEINPMYHRSMPYQDTNRDLNIFRENIENSEDHVNSEFDDEILKLEDVFEADSPQENKITERKTLRVDRKLGLNDCIASAIELRDGNSVIKALAKPQSSKCSGSYYRTCNANWYKSDWQNQKETCHSLKGVVVRYEKMNIVCAYRNNGATISLTYTRNYVPYCFPGDDCTSNLPNMCTVYAARSADILENELKKNYSRVSCIGTPVNCEVVREGDDSNSSNKTTLIIVLSTTIPAVLAILMCFGIMIRKKQIIAKAEETTTNSNVESETKTNKKCFGFFKGWLRDKYFWHIFFYVALVTWILLWIIMGGEPCVVRRRRCDIKHPTFFWRAPDMLVVRIIVLLFLYGAFMWEFHVSSTSKYLRNINHTESLMQILDRNYKTEPELSWTVTCYHIEYRTVTSTDSKGNAVSRTESYPVVTYTETEKVNITSWEDISEPLRKEDVSIYELTKVKISIDYDATGNYMGQGESLKSRNQHRDVMCDLTSYFTIPGLSATQTSKAKMLVYVDLAKKPSMLTFYWCFFFHLTVIGSLPYRLWVSGTTGMTETTIKKSLQTHWEGYKGKPSNE